MRVETLACDKKMLAMFKRHCYEMIKLLMERKINFSIVCAISRVKFEPELPDEIFSTFNDLTVFILAGYTFESLELDEDNLYFEAGFGKDNLGSFVTVPLKSIVQVLLPSSDSFSLDSCLYINLLATFESSKKSEEGIHSSMKALLSNPKNYRFKK